MKFSESEEHLGIENQKTTQHETKEVVSNPNSKVRIYNFDNFDIMHAKLKALVLRKTLVEINIFDEKLPPLKEAKKYEAIKPSKCNTDKVFNDKVYSIFT